MKKEDVSGLTGLFSGSIANILDFLLIHKGFDYTKTEIAENAGVEYKTLFDKKLQHEIMFYDAEIVAQEQAEAEREVVLGMKKEKVEA